jgi:glucose/mannose transport system permease protein
MAAGGMESGAAVASNPSAPHPLGAVFTAFRDRWLPAVLLSPSVALSFVFVYVFVFMTGYLSLSPSTLIPRYRFVGLGRYRELFNNPAWWDSVRHLAVFGLLFVVVTLALGLLLAILLDQQIRGEGVLRAIYLYPLALSQVVAGTAWQWLLSPGSGIERVMQNLGWTGFRFEWINEPDRAIYCVVIATVWQSTGFVAALFLAGLRGVDDEIIRAAQIEGASGPMIYRRVVIPSIAPTFFSALMILVHLAIKTFDIVVAMTSGGPGFSTWLPSYFMYIYAFERGRLGVSAASSMMMLMMVVAVMVPLMYMASARTRHEA